MMDTTLLEKEGPVTLEDLRANFRAHDFSAMSSGYDKEHESSQRNTRFKRIVKCFKKAWREQMKEMTGKNMVNFAPSSPVGCMELSESELVAGTLVDIMEDEAWLDQLFEIGMTVLRQPLEKELEKRMQGKSMEELTEEEFKQRKEKLESAEGTGYKPKSRERKVSKALKAYASLAGSADIGGVRVIE